MFPETRDAIDSKDEGRLVIPNTPKNIKTHTHTQTNICMYNARHSRFRFVDWQTGIHINVYERWSITYKYHLHMSPKRYFWYAGRLKSTVPSYDTQCLNEHLAIGRLPVTQRGNSVQFMCSICHKYIQVHWVPANMWRKERAVQVIKDRVHI